MSTAGYILLAVLVLLVMITVHELGHYISGKIFGFGIDEFAIGFGPKLFSKSKKDGEVFSVLFCRNLKKKNDSRKRSFFTVVTLG